MTKASEAIVNLLRQINPTPHKPISLFQLGIPLIVEAEEKFTQDEVLNGLYWLRSEKVIELPGNNTLRLMKPSYDLS